MQDAAGGRTVMSSDVFFSRSLAAPVLQHQGSIHWITHFWGGITDQAVQMYGDFLGPIM